MSLILYYSSAAYPYRSWAAFFERHLANERKTISVWYGVRSTLNSTLQSFARRSRTDVCAFSVISVGFRTRDNPSSRMLPRPVLLVKLYIAVATVLYCTLQTTDQLAKSAPLGAVQHLFRSSSSALSRVWPGAKARHLSDGSQRILRACISGIPVLFQTSAPAATVSHVGGLSILLAHYTTVEHAGQPTKFVGIFLKKLPGSFPQRP